MMKYRKILCVVCLFGVMNFVYSADTNTVKHELSKLKELIADNPIQKLPIQKFGEINNNIILEIKATEKKDISILTDELNIYATVNNYKVPKNTAYCLLLTDDAYTINPKHFLQQSKKIIEDESISDEYKIELIGKWFRKKIYLDKKDINKKDYIELFEIAARKGSYQVAFYALQLLLGLADNPSGYFSDNKPIDKKMGKAVLKGKVIHLTNQLAEYYELLLKADPGNKDAIHFLTNYIENTNPMYSDYLKKRYKDLLEHQKNN